MAIRVAVRSVCLSREVESVRVQERSVDGSQYNPLFAWDAVVRDVRISYADIILGGRIPDVES